MNLIRIWLSQITTNKIGQALRTEKRKDYMNVVQVQIALVVAALTFEGLAEIFGLPYGRRISDFFVLGLGSLYMFMLWDMLRNFTRNALHLLFILSGLTLAFATTLVFANPFFSFFPHETARWPLFWVHVCLFYTECTIIYFSILDIFKDETHLRNKLWGSACIYLMIGIAFGSLFDLLNIAHPGALGEVLPPGTSGYIRCIRYSMNVLAGTDSEFPNSIPLIVNLGVIESIWSNMYVVLVVGRLLSKDH